MAKPEWGLKRICQTCAAKFYDLQRSPIVCPKCGAEFDPEAMLKTRRGRSSAAAAVAEPEAKPTKTAEPKAAAEESEDEDLIEDDSEGDDLIEDTDDLGEDDEDLPDVDGEEEDND